ncbi:MAG: sigma-70 family RNA polymerase sigma factor [Balneolales bacterium]
MKKNIAGKVLLNNGPEKPVTVGDADYHELIQIISGCREYHTHSQEKLYKKFYGYALGVALSYCPTRDDAIEVVNDSFMKVFKHIDKYSSTGPFKPWLRKIVVNTSIDKARANGRFKNQVDIDTLERASPTDIESELNARQIYNLLNELPELLRFVFNMYEIEGYSHREIAIRLSIAESSSRAYLTRAKTLLKHHYENTFLDEP